MEGRWVAYYRVSTGGQNVEMPAQRQAVENYLNGGGWKLIDEFVEVESGKRDNNRPQLHAALALCRKKRATLIIAKLDRLARDTHFVTGLQKSGVAFVCCDNPHANKMTIQMLAVFAEHERDMISARTSASLQALKASGKPWVSKKSGRLVERLGSPDPRKASAAGCKAVSEAADEFAARMLPVIQAIQGRGIVTLAGIAGELERQKWPTARGSSHWSLGSVRNILMRQRNDLSRDHGQ
jgi:DNA invertase Pin-like site-specific DNA recombinase